MSFLPINSIYHLLTFLLHKTRLFLSLKITSCAGNRFKLVQLNQNSNLQTLRVNVHKQATQLGKQLHQFREIVVFKSAKAGFHEIVQKIQAGFHEIVQKIPIPTC